MVTTNALWSGTKTGRYVRCVVPLPLQSTVIRYLLLEWKFSSAEVGHKTLEGVSAKSLLRFFKDRVKAYHGDYGVACIQHSLTGEPLWHLNHFQTYFPFTCSQIPQPLHAGHHCPVCTCTPSCCVVSPVRHCVLQQATLHSITATLGRHHTVLPENSS